MSWALINHCHYVQTGYKELKLGIDKISTMVTLIFIIHFVKREYFIEYEYDQHREYWKATHGCRYII